MKSWRWILFGLLGATWALADEVDEIMDDMKAYGVANETLAIDAWDPGLVEGFEAKGVKVIPATELMFQARKIKNQDEVEHIYIRDAVKLRPDLSGLQPVDWNELESWIAEQMD